MALNKWLKIIKLKYIISKSISYDMSISNFFQIIWSSTCMSFNWWQICCVAKIKYRKYLRKNMQMDWFSLFAITCYIWNRSKHLRAKGYFLSALITRHNLHHNFPHKKSFYDNFIDHKFCISIMSSIAFASLLVMDIVAISKAKKLYWISHLI